MINLNAKQVKCIRCGTSSYSEKYILCANCILENVIMIIDDNSDSGEISTDTLKYFMGSVEAIKDFAEGGQE